jgi:cytochrome c oxidase subunit I+III
VPELAKAFFTAASMMIAIPTGVQVFCWIATLWKGRLVFRTPLLFVLAFFFILVLGGLTGVILASTALDAQVHDTYFVVAHLHYVLIGGAVFPLFGAWYYWFPKITGRLMDERLGRWNFWLFFVGFNVTFYPMHHLGLEGMPRRIYTYPAETGWGPLNLLASVGAAMIAVSMLLFVINVVKSLRGGAPAPANPWNASSLEWATDSPPPAYNFGMIPVVTSREPLWTPPDPARPTHVTGLAVDVRQTLVTTALDAVPDSRETSPEPTIWPFVSSVATSIMFIASIFTPWAVIWGTIPVVIAIIAWFWPDTEETARHAALDKRP